jgi:CheY-like chemotaxis protein
MEAGLSPNTLYQLLKRPEVRPNPDTCRKLAEFFKVPPLSILELAGHVAPDEGTPASAGYEAVLGRRGDLRDLLASLQDLSPPEVQLVQQMVDRLRVRRRAEAVASGAAVALVVEDTPDARASIVHMLQAAGLKVLEAADGQRAVELMQTSGALVDVILMDYKMPRLNGVEATREIRKQFPELPIVFVSAYDEPDMKQAAFDVGAAEYLLAPVGFEQLIDAVSRVRRQPAAAATGQPVRVR